MQPLPTPGSQQAKDFDMVFGNESINPFEIPRTLPIHVASVISLAGLIQRKRREKQAIVEVGVWQAIMSRWLLTCMPHINLHMVDPWRAAQPGDTWYDGGDRFAKKPQAQFDAYYALAQKVAEQFAPRATIHRMPSLAAAPQFADGSLDVVFIDAAHDKANVMADIYAWHKKVRPGGFLSGHDYKVEGNYFGLIDGVNSATRELGLEIEVLPGKVWACWIPEPGQSRDPFARIRTKPSSAPSVAQTA